MLYFKSKMHITLIMQKWGKEHVHLGVCLKLKTFMLILFNYKHTFQNVKLVRQSMTIDIILQHTIFI